MVTRIREFVEIYREELFFVFIVIIVGLIGFGLGRLSLLQAGQGSGDIANLEIKSTPIGAEELLKLTGEGSEKTDGDSAGPTDIVGNRNSKIFHLSHCPGARNMSEVNKVFFSSINAAIEAGYRAAGNCPGL